MAQFAKQIGDKLGGFRPSRIMSEFGQNSAVGRGELFRSARLKLSAFYLVVLIAFSLILTLSLRGLAGHAFDQAGAGDRGAVQQLLHNYFSVPIEPKTFNEFQTNQSANVHHDLDVYVFVINLAAVVFGGAMSYWYAGRILRPIEQAHEAQARFASDASHELRTPLAALKVENEVFLRQKTAKVSEARDLIHSNLEEVQRLENLASNLLALGQYEQISLELSPVSLAGVVNSAIDHADKAAHSRHITFKTNVEASAYAMGNTESLVQLVGIVLDNAVKYGPAKGKVYVDAIRGDNHYHLSIRDEGDGISETDLPYVFDRLYRGDKSRTSKTPGYGLGLSLAREIVRANKGSITARNYPSGGAQFVISLQAAKGRP